MFKKIEHIFMAKRTEIYKGYDLFSYCKPTANLMTKQMLTQNSVYKRRNEKRGSVT